MTGEQMKESWEEQQKRLAAMAADNCYREWNLNDRDRAAIAEALSRATRVSDMQPRPTPMHQLALGPAEKVVTMTGYNLAELAKKLEGDDGGFTDATAWLARAEHRGKSFEQLWAENGSWVRYDLCILAGLRVTAPEHAVKRALVRLCVQHKVGFVTIEAP